VDTTPKQAFKPNVTTADHQQAQIHPGNYSPPLLYLIALLIMPPKAKSVETSENSILPPPIDLDHIPLEKKDYKITELKCEFDFFELHFWLKYIFLD
jgi:hypothetical protein